jgi:hypothetical protein
VAGTQTSASRWGMTPSLKTHRTGCPCRTISRYAVGSSEKPPHSRFPCPGATGLWALVPTRVWEALPPLVSSYPSSSMLHLSVHLVVYSFTYQILTEELYTKHCSTHWQCGRKRRSPALALLYSVLSSGSVNKHTD